jgi:hypothetical protein
MNGCLAYAKIKKLYQWKTEADLIHKVKWVAGEGNGSVGLISIARYGYGIDVPRGFYSVVSESVVRELGLLPHQDSLTAVGEVEKCDGLRPTVGDRKTKTVKPDFQEGNIYWHEEKQKKFRIFKIFKSVKKCEGYVAGDPFKVKIALSELSPLPDDSAPVPSPVTELIPVVELPDEVDSPVEQDNSLTASSDEVDLPVEQDNSLTASSDEVDLPVEQGNSLTGINIYKARGSAKGENRYYRYSCKIGKRTKHYHIPGGNIHSVASRSRAEEVAKAVASGLPPADVVKIIESWKGAS